MPNTQLVAVYGSLKKGYGNHSLLESSELKGITETSPSWTMYDLGSFPGIVPGHTNIHIEVYEVNQETFQRLDMLEGYPSFYDRKEIETKYGSAWIYFLAEKDNYMQSIVEHGIW